jgi:hypothetical protein
MLGCHGANLLPQNAKKATPWKSGNRPLCLVLVVGASYAGEATETLGSLSNNFLNRYDNAAMLKIL